MTAIDLGLGLLRVVRARALGGAGVIAAADEAKTDRGGEDDGSNLHGAQS